MNACSAALTGTANVSQDADDALAAPTEKRSAGARAGVGVAGLWFRRLTNRGAYLPRAHTPTPTLDTRTLDSETTNRGHGKELPARL